MLGTVLNERHGNSTSYGRHENSFWKFIVIVSNLRKINYVGDILKTTIFFDCKRYFFGIFLKNKAKFLKFILAI